MSWPVTFLVMYGPAALVFAVFLAALFLPGEPAKTHDYSDGHRRP